MTEAGRDYLAVVRDVFERLELGTDRLLQRQRSGTIALSTSPDFAAKWLVSRLRRFAETYPEIELKLATWMHRVDLRGKMWTSRSGMATGNGPSSTLSIFAPRNCSEFAALR